MSSSPLLSVQNVCKRFGQALALSDVCFEVSHAHIHGLIGPNGAGKTTLFNVLAGLYTPDGGQLHLDGVGYRPRDAKQAAHTGVSRTFQNIRVFPRMTVLDNVMVGTYSRTQGGIWSAVFHTRRHKNEEAKVRETAEALLNDVGLDQRARDLACTLSYGDQRRLEIARALALSPRLLMLDEPAAGMNATEKQTLGALLCHIRDTRRLTLLLVEHDVKWITSLCDRLTVLHHGKVLADGLPEAVQRHPEVISAYLGQPKTTADTEELGHE